MLDPKAGASEPYEDRRDSVIPEIPSGMQAGPVSSSHCGHWIGAHQWPAQLINTNCSKLLEMLNVRESAGLKSSLQIYGWLCHSMIGESRSVPSYQHSSKWKYSIRLKIFCYDQPKHPSSSLSHCWTNTAWTHKLSLRSIYEAAMKSYWQRRFLRKYPLLWLASQ